MAPALRPEEITAVTALPAAARYEHFVKRVADWETVWSLRGDTGWVLAGDGGREAVPVWPHAEYAAACAAGEWAGAEAAPIALDAWMDAWLPGMARDGRLVAVFPVVGGQHSTVEPERLAADLARELEAYD